MASQTLPTPPSILDQASALLQLFGGTKTTSNPGDVSALQTTLAGLQGQDYSAMLQAIFNKAGGQIPGLQRALSNATGSRTGNNSAMAAAMQKLLAETTTNAADQVAKLQAQNMQTQASVGNSIAAATAGTTKKTGTDVGKGATTGAQILAVLQAAKALGITDAGKNLFGMGTANTTGGAGQATQQAAPMFGPPISAANFESAPQASAQFMGPDWNAIDSIFTPSADATPVFAAPAPAPAILPEDETGFSYQDYTPTVAPVTAGGYDDYWPEFADGGLVTKKGKGYADGGTIRAGGSRRSANPTVQLAAPEQSTVTQSNSLLQAAAPVQPPTGLGSVAASSLANAFPSGGITGTGTGGTTGNSASTGTGQSMAGAIGTLGALNSVSGLTGGPAFGGSTMAGLGMLGGLSAATTGAEAASAVGKGVLGAASPAAGALFGLASNPTATNAANLGLSMANPGYALASALASVFGLANPAEAVANMAALANPNIAMSAEQQAIAAIEAANPGSLGLTAQANSVEGDALEGLLGLTGSFGTDGSSAAGDAGNSGDGTASGGETGSGDTLANGGPISGRGTGISDSIPVKVSDGEYIISADVVETLGEDFFNQLQAAFHTPAAQQRARN